MLKSLLTFSIGSNRSQLHIHVPCPNDDASLLPNSHRFVYFSITPTPSCDSLMGHKSLNTLGTKIIFSSPTIKMDRFTSVPYLFFFNTCISFSQYDLFINIIHILYVFNKKNNNIYRNIIFIKNMAK